MSIETSMGLFVAMALAPALRRATAPIRRLVKRKMADGPLKRILLTPMRYTKKGREAEHIQAMIDDHELLPSGDQLVQRNSAR